MKSQQKGMANIVYIVGLIVIFIISITYIRPFLSKPKANVVEIAINNNIYLMRDSLEMAKLYIDDAAGNSLYQAMYENGKRGGFSSSESERLNFEGKEYVLWYNNKDSSPTENDITRALESVVEKNLENYTKEEVITSIFKVRIPGYDQITVMSDNGAGVRVLGTGSGYLSVTRVTEDEEEIVIQKSSKIDILLHLPYYQLYKEALDYHEYLHEPFTDMLADCDKAVIEKTMDEFGYTLTSKVMDTTDGSCLVKVEAATKREFLVWDGSKAVLEKISLVFMERLESEYERCNDCTNSGMEWCVDEKVCAESCTGLSIADIMDC
jgi:hypothetical protein